MAASNKLRSRSDGREGMLIISLMVCGGTDAGGLKWLAAMRWGCSLCWLAVGGGMRLRRYQSAAALILSEWRLRMYRLCPCTIRTGHIPAKEPGAARLKNRTP